MNAVFGWLLAVAALAAGYAAYGWRGVLLAFSIVVFWLLLQFSRALRVMRQAAQNPVGHVDNAVMLHARLHPGMKLMQILPLTRSLGEKAEADAGAEIFVWRDDAGDAVRVALRDGRVSSVSLTRAAAAGDKSDSA